MGGIAVRYLKQSRGNKAALCAPGSQEPGAAGGREGRCLGACAPRLGRALVTESFPPQVLGALVNPFRGRFPEQAKRETGFHLLAVTCLIEKKK